jgi:hypothetical protein
MGASVHSELIDWVNQYLIGQDRRCQAKTLMRNVRHEWRMAG